MTGNWVEPQCHSLCVVMISPTCIKQWSSEVSAVPPPWAVFALKSQGAESLTHHWLGDASRHLLTVFHDFVQAGLFSYNEVLSMWTLNCKWGLCWHWRKWSCLSRRGRIWAWLSMWQFLIHCFFLFPHFEQPSNYFLVWGSFPNGAGATRAKPGSTREVRWWQGLNRTLPGMLSVLSAASLAWVPQFKSHFVWCLKIVLLTCWLCPVSHFKAKCFFR